jgi:hypothetical protein
MACSQIYILDRFDKFYFFYFLACVLFATVLLVVSMTTKNDLENDP